MTIHPIDATHLSLKIEDEAETDRLGRALATLVRPGDVIGLVGTLGAGKTRLVRALAEALGADPLAIASPTFVLIHEYRASLPLFHFDAYRLADPNEFDTLGAAEYWQDGGGVCLIEWADLVANRLPASTWWIRIALDGSTGRMVTIQMPEVGRLADLLWTKLNG